MEAIDLMLRRRSVKPDAMVEPAPDDSALRLILQAATRVPDHGKLTPWRIHILREDGQQRLGDFLADLFAREIPEANDRQIAFERRRPQRAPLLLVVVSKPQPSRKIPDMEQLLSAGAVCYGLLMATHALGYCGQWLTEWPAYRREVVEFLGHDPEKDRVIGFVYLGSTAEPPEDRPRPALEDVAAVWPRDAEGP